MWHAWFTLGGFFTFCNTYEGMRSYVSHHGSCGQVSAPMDIEKYREWLWAASGESISGFGQVPGILILVDAVLERKRKA